MMRGRLGRPEIGLSSLSSLSLPSHSGTVSLDLTTPLLEELYSGGYVASVCGQRSWLLLHAFCRPFFAAAGSVLLSYFSLLLAEKENNHGRVTRT